MRVHDRSEDRVESILDLDRGDPASGQGILADELSTVART
jgi:hypothetical protein